MIPRTGKRVFSIAICLSFLLFPHILLAEYENMVLIPEGEFTMGSNVGESDERPEHGVFLNSYYIDIFEVTNADYARFLNAVRPSDEEAESWILIESDYSRLRNESGKFRALEGYEDHPVVMVSFDGAIAFAAWAKKRLPTEAEWEKAARGGLKNARYPWGNTIDTARSNYARKKVLTTPVGLYPPNGFGLYDMAGNVSEMVSDFYAADYYSAMPDRNPTGPPVGEFRVIRGGDWISAPSALSVGNRGKIPASPIYLPNTGFRCVKDVK